MHDSKEHAVIVMPDGRPQIWPVRGKSLQELEAFCATSGAAVLAIHPTLEEAAKALSAMDEWTPDLPNWLTSR
jgi:hypothetical protein